MFERYTEAARRALFFARFETSQLGGWAIETEHLLLGLIRDARGLLVHVLAGAGVSPEDIRRAVDARVTFKEKVSTSIEIPFSADAKRVLGHAAEEADRLQHAHIGREHLLLGILREERSLGAGILLELGLKLDEGRRQIVRLLAEGYSDDLEDVPGTPAAMSRLKTGVESAPASAARSSESPKLYSELAAWWPLLSPPSHYVEEAADLLPELLAAPDAPPRTLLELGSGGGSLAFHVKEKLQLTLTDRSPQMLAVSLAVNPECEHILGDMRTLRLDRQFDLVLIHDAIMFATDEASVRAVLDTASRHCRPGGAVAVVPDCVKETFTPATESGGEDAPDGRGLRYVEWTWDPDPDDTTAEVAYAYLLRERGGTVRVEMDRYQFGLFRRESWLLWLDQAGFTAGSRMDPWNRDVFIGRKRR